MGQLPTNPFSTKKVGTSFLLPYEDAFFGYLAPKLPRWLKTYHLTLATLPISLLIIIFSYLAREVDFKWMWAISVLIFIQWLTDSLDGRIGRLHNEGLVRWGYYMDHFLDYVFLASLLTSYMIVAAGHYKYWHFFIFVIFGAYMVNTFLAFAVTNEFKIFYMGIGPTEIRLLLIVLNTLLLIFGRTYLAGALPYALAVAVIGLIIVVYDTQKHIWNIDMALKNQSSPRK